MIILKIIAGILAIIWLMNTLYAYCAAIEKLEEKVNRLFSLQLFVSFSFVGFIAFALLIVDFVKHQ